MQFIHHNARLLSIIVYARRELESWPLSHFTYEARKYSTFILFLEFVKKLWGASHLYIFFLLVKFPGLIVTICIAQLYHRYKILKTTFKNPTFYRQEFIISSIIFTFKVNIWHYGASLNEIDISNMLNAKEHWLKKKIKNKNEAERKIHHLKSECCSVGCCM